MRDEILVLVRVRDQARATGHAEVASVYDDAIVSYYAWRIASGVGPDGFGRMTPEQLKAAMARDFAQLFLDALRLADFCL